LTQIRKTVSSFCRSHRHCTGRAFPSQLAFAVLLGLGATLPVFTCRANPQTTIITRPSKFTGTHQGNFVTHAIHAGFPTSWNFTCNPTEAFCTPASAVDALSMVDSRTIRRTCFGVTKKSHPASIAATATIHTMPEITAVFFTDDATAIGICVTGFTIAGVVYTISMS